jgi:hypothetical protein
MEGIGQTPTNQFSPSFMISMCFMVKSVSEIDPFLLYNQRALENLGMDRPNVFS